MEDGPQSKGCSNHKYCQNGKPKTKKLEKNQDNCGRGSYSAQCPGWHEYITTNVVCPSELHCSKAEMKDDLLRFAYPGQDPSQPVVSQNFYSVSWPGTNISMGSLGAIQTFVLDGGLTIENRTLSTHILYDGKVDRTISQTPDGSWVVTTRGIGNNVTHNVAVPLADDLGTINIPVNLALLNGWGGPILPGGIDIFNAVDENMLNYIAANH